MNNKMNFIVLDIVDNDELIRIISYSITLLLFTQAITFWKGRQNDIDFLKFFCSNRHLLNTSIAS